MFRRILAVVCTACALWAPAASAQTVDVSAKPLTDSDIQLLRSNIQQDKNAIIAQTMQFTDAESSAFWPVYQDYARNQHAIADKRLQLIKDYANSAGIMDDAKAKNLTERMISIDDETLNLRKAYWPRFEKALGAKRAAKFYQVDNRLSLMINVQLASEIPLVP
ncbi:MAG TPA: hypothetical protein VK699_13160 [Terriglobales bacterium]|jgi:hypothetical protein|nr:hypothetical protein [Terriglobales bacterium]